MAERGIRQVIVVEGGKLAGVVNEMRSMITGRYVVPQDHAK